MRVNELAEPIELAFADTNREGMTYRLALALAVASAGTCL